MIDTVALHWALRISHIVAGGIGLLVFWVPVFAKKGGRIHTLSGTLFKWLAYFVSATAAVSCTWALVDPIGFSGISKELSEQDATRVASNIRFFFAILAVLMTWLIAGLQLGVYSMRTKGKPDSSRSRVLFFQGFAGMSSIGLAIFGLSLWLGSGQSRSIIPIALGFFGVIDSKKAMSGLINRPKSEHDWWYTHMECMIGSGIAFHTAFFVFGFSRISGFELQGWLAVTPWLVPTALGVPATFLWIAYYRRQFESAPESASVRGMPSERLQRDNDFDQ